MNDISSSFSHVIVNDIIIDYSLVRVFLTYVREISNKRISWPIFSRVQETIYARSIEHQCHVEWILLRRGFLLEIEKEEEEEGGKKKNSRLKIFYFDVILRSQGTKNWFFKMWIFECGLENWSIVERRRRRRRKNKFLVSHIFQDISSKLV